MEAIKLRARVRSGGRLEWDESAPAIPEGDVEVILLYKQAEGEPNKPSAVADWPVLDGGAYRGGALRREDFYGRDGR